MTSNIWDEYQAYPSRSCTTKAKIDGNRCCLRILFVLVAQTCIFVYLGNEVSMSDDLNPRGRQHQAGHEGPIWLLVTTTVETYRCASRLGAVGFRPVYLNFVFPVKPPAPFPESFGNEAADICISLPKIQRSKKLVSSKRRYHGPLRPPSKCAQAARN